VHKPPGSGLMKPAEAFGVVVPFVEELGILVESVEHGRVVSVLDVKPHHCNSWGAPHGGVVMTLLDFTMSLAGASVQAPGHGTMTIEMKTNFIAAGEGRLTCEGKVAQAGRSLIFCSGEVRDARGRLCAQALGTFKMYIRKTERR
jgi:uncharacterized protein (TIGR00369 family)